MSDPSRSDRSHLLATWARRYAQNRNAAALVGLLGFGLLFVAIAASAHFAGRAYRAGDTPLLLFTGTVLVVSMLVNLYVAIPRNTARLFARLNDSLYAGEGQVSIAVPERVSRRTIRTVAVLFGACVLASVFLGDRIEPAYRQPVAALYCVPFLTFIILLQRPAISRIALLWPMLFAAHAVLILLGFPIVFEGRWETLNILIPVIGYGVLTHLIQLIYSRIAISRVKQLSQSGFTEDERTTAETGSNGRD